MTGLQGEEYFLGVQNMADDEPEKHTPQVLCQQPNMWIAVGQEGEREHATGQTVANVQQNGVHARVLQWLTIGPHFVVIDEQEEHYEHTDCTGTSQRDKREGPQILVDWNEITRNGKHCSDNGCWRRGRERVKTLTRN